jgi:hypothetical protein
LTHSWENISNFNQKPFSKIKQSSQNPFYLRK